MTSTMFPMIGGPSVPWSVAEEIYRVYCDVLGGSNQTLERIAERGGFGWSEVPLLTQRYERKHGKNPWSTTLKTAEQSACLLSVVTEEEIEQDCSIYGSAYVYRCVCGQPHRIAPLTLTTYRTVSKT